MGEKIKSKEEEKRESWNTKGKECQNKKRFSFKIMIAVAIFAITISVATIVLMPSKVNGKSVDSKLTSEQNLVGLFIFFLTTNNRQSED